MSLGVGSYESPPTLLVALGTPLARFIADLLDGLGFRLQGLGLRVRGLGCGVKGLRVWGLEFEVWG